VFTHPRDVAAWMTCAVSLREPDAKESGSLSRHAACEQHEALLFSAGAELRRRYERRETSY
jgi:hypothetical protein